MLAMKRRSAGAQSRRAPVRLFALVDKALSSESGLSPSHFCSDHECSDDTLRRYLLELVGSGKRLTQAAGMWRYDVGEERLFTESGYRLFFRQ